MAKYDWPRLKQEFIEGSWLTITSFLRSKNIKSNSRTRSQSKGWQEARGEYLKEIVTQTRQQALQGEVEIRLRQQEEAKLMQTKGMESLNMLDVTTADEARKLITAGLEQERRAMGLEGNFRPSKLTQVNVAVGPKTKFDSMIENLSYEELLHFIAEIRKEKEIRKQRSG